MFRKPFALQIVIIALVSLAGCTTDLSTPTGPTSPQNLGPGHTDLPPLFPE